MYQNTVLITINCDSWFYIPVIKTKYSRPIVMALLGSEQLFLVHNWDFRSRFNLRPLGTCHSPTAHFKPHVLLMAADKNLRPTNYIVNRYQTTLYAAYHSVARRRLP